MATQIEEPGNKNNRASFSLFALGFRPFFLLAGISAVILIYIWVSHYSLASIIFTISGFSPSAYYSSVNWHAHEMLFGYTVAVIAGFLLTAVGNWTGIKMINGWSLALLSLLWLSGRVFPLVSGLPDWLVLITDLAFIPILMLLIAVPIIRVKQWNNLVFIPVLLLMFLANCIFHFNQTGLITSNAANGNIMMLYLVVLLIVIMGGRVIPFFTERGVTGVITKKWKWIELLAPASVVLVFIIEMSFNDRVLNACVALLVAIIHLVRLAGWYSNKIWKIPLVWILQLAYFWFVIGFMLKGLMIFKFAAAIDPYHAFTVGGIGIMTLGMMARVSLGHTGREMKTNRVMVIAFIMINLAVVARVIAPVFIPAAYLQLVSLSGLLWIIAFAIFLFVYIPMWMSPRVDGRDG